MGRSGGNSGSSGNRSSGGFSGGGRSSGSSSNSTSHSSFGSSFGSNSRSHSDHRPPPMSRSHHYSPPPPRYGYSRPPRYSGYGYRYRKTTIADLIVPVIIIIIFCIAFKKISNSNLPEKISKQYYEKTTTQISKSSTKRTALNNEANITEWFENSLGWITNGSELTKGLEEFYNKTGIQPYIVFVPYSTEYWSEENFNEETATTYLDNLYSSIFQDEAHFIFAYFEKNQDSKSEMEGEFRYLSGKSADKIMDSEAIDIFWKYFETNYYNTNLSIEKMISNTFSETASNIM